MDPICKEDFLFNVFFFFFSLLVMVLNCFSNDLFLTILVINFLVFSIICTSIKSLLLGSKQVFHSKICHSGLDLNNINASFSFSPNLKLMANYLVFGKIYS